MKRGFYTIMTAQFFSSLADNALFVAAIELLRSQHAPNWQAAALVPLFALFYVILPPFVGAIGIKQILGQYGALNAVIIKLGTLDVAGHDPCARGRETGHQHAAEATACPGDDDAGALEAFHPVPLAPKRRRRFNPPISRGDLRP